MRIQPGTFYMERNDRPKSSYHKTIVTKAYKSLKAETKKVLRVFHNSITVLGQFKVV